MRSDRKPEAGIYLNERSIRFYERCVAVAHQLDRSLAPLVSGYRKQLTRVHIRHLHLTGVLVSPLRRVPFVKQPQKEPKRPCPSVRPSLRSGSLAPVPLRGHAVTGHPWPNTALPASMPVDPLRRTSSRPPDGAGRSRSKADQKPARRPTGRPVGVSVCRAIYVAADEERRLRSVAKRPQNLSTGFT